MLHTRNLIAGLLPGVLLLTATTAVANDRTPLARHAVQAISEIYHLDRRGNETALSLRGIDWQPTEASLLLSPATGDWFALLDSPPDIGPDEGRLALATVTRAGSRRVAIGANPLHDLARSHRTGGAADEVTERWFDNTIAWLLDDEMPFAPEGRALRIVLANLNGTSGDGPDRITRRWFSTRAPQVRLSDPWSCDDELLASCLEGADLLVLGPGDTLAGAGSAVAGAGRGKAALGEALDRADALGLPVLYLHEDDRLASDGNAVAPRLSALQALGLTAGRNARSVGVVRGVAPAASVLAPVPTLQAASGL